MFVWCRGLLPWEAKALGFVLWGGVCGKAVLEYSLSEKYGGGLAMLPAFAADSCLLVPVPRRYR